VKVKDKNLLTAEVAKNLQKFLLPKKVVARLYVLKGKALTPKDGNNSDPYLIVKLGDKKVVDKESLRPDTCNPGFYTHYDMATELPGACTLAVECWDDDGFDLPDLIGITKIDLEDRYFNKDWANKYPNLKPVEERTLFIEKSSAPQGVLQCWLEIMDTKTANSTPALDIRPAPREDYELRVIIWGTKDVVYKDEATQCNDLYVRGILGKTTLESDTHWRCRAKGSFNWRWKIPMKLPLDYDEEYGMDILTVRSKSRLPSFRFKCGTET